jgi:hypothetical protein
VRGHLGNLVEQKRPARGGLDQAPLVAVGPRERAALVAEQLRLDEFRGDGRAVDADEGEVGARAPEVKGGGDQLLARAGLALDEDGGVRGRGGADDLPNLPHLRVVADEPEVVAVGGERAPEDAVLALDGLKL